MVMTLFPAPGLFSGLSENPHSRDADAQRLGVRQRSLRSCRLQDCMPERPGDRCAHAPRQSLARDYRRPPRIEPFVLTARVRRASSIIKHPHWVMSDFSNPARRLFHMWITPATVAASYSRKRLTDSPYPTPCSPPHLGRGIRGGGSVQQPTPQPSRGSRRRSRESRNPAADTGRSRRGGNPVRGERVC
jgi:hypothetical protein